ncbi:hypothetical protein L226DRAFT_373865 [Lentinus tigrinus ALCF2SS1-7]|uniref:Uncharacterized protein n=1 Tax=Lentinus tigrinus ALCF2SS1-6 TaxID=1328759 RepID=A0A5C2SKI3_9APHY|nr:hypothetical protein L227DRAFT_319357 [Lentinus tigrinus ALCF2SS1-6]RPD76342.1 hypothetical protein L226DRAFT_373865 [Lentinus tigrinus ALCF2SS1-7]
MMPLRSSASVIARARRSLEDANEEHARAILKSKSQINRLTLVASLPPELLSSIFLSIVREHFAQTALAATASNDPPARSPNTWIKISHVCRDWRIVVLGTPKLWSYVMITGIFPVEVFLTRSKRALLSVVAKIPSPHNYTHKAHLARVLVEFARLKNLQIIRHPQDIGQICKEINGCAPFLETFTVALDSETIMFAPFGYHWDPTHSIPLFHVLSPDRLPRLRTLNISNVPFRWDNPMFSATLTTLVVSKSVNF